MSVVSFVCDVIGIVVNSTSALPFLHIHSFVRGVKSPSPGLHNVILKNGWVLHGGGLKVLALTKLYQTLGFLGSIC